MANDHHDLGELRSVHRPSTVRLWLMALVALALLSFVILGVLALLNSLISGSPNNKEGMPISISAPAVCLGVPVLLLALISSFLLQDFRKWSATRSSKLTLFEKGFTYETGDRIETCRWDEIKDITFRRVEVGSKHSPPRRVNLIRSVVRKDGEMISLAETLNLTRITQFITAARKL
jgi:hypothetical protein